MEKDLSVERAVVSRSDKLYRLGDLKGAMLELKPLIEAKTDYFRPYYNTGFFHWLLADYAEAVHYVEAAVEREPKFADARLLLAKALVAQRLFARAVEQLDAYESLGGSDRSAPLWKSRALWGLQREDEANAILLEYADADGWATPKQDGLFFSQEPWFLRHAERWTKHLKPIMGGVRRGLEIGSMEGFSAIWIAEHLISPRGKLVLNDIEFRKNLLTNIERSRFKDKFELKLGDSKSVLPTLMTSSFEFIYVDGDHSTAGVFRDCVNAAALAAPGAFVILDDYGKGNEGTKKGIDTFLAIFGRCFDIIEKDYQVFMRRRNLPLKITGEDIRTIGRFAPDRSKLAQSSPLGVLQALRSGEIEIAGDR